MPCGLLFGRHFKKAAAGCQRQSNVRAPSPLTSASLPQGETEKLREPQPPMHGPPNELWARPLERLDGHLSRIDAIHAILRTTATLANGLDAYFPLVGACLTLAKDVVSVVQRAESLRMSAAIYASHLGAARGGPARVDRLDTRTEQALARRTHPGASAQFQRTSLLVSAPETLHQITSMTKWKAFYNNTAASNNLKLLEDRVDQCVQLVSLDAPISRNVLHLEIMDQLRADREASQAWATQASADMQAITGAISELGTNFHELSNAVREQMRYLNFELGSVAERQRGTLNVTSTLSERSNPPNVYHVGIVRLPYQFHDEFFESLSGVDKAIKSNVQIGSARLETLFQLILHGPKTAIESEALKTLQQEKDRLNACMKQVFPAPPSYQVSITEPSLSSSTSSSADSRVVISPTELHRASAEAHIVIGPIAEEGRASVGGEAQDLASIQDAPSAQA